jgi:LPLT family lysophospholipid transporter-like MFS transporter
MKNVYTLLVVQFLSAFADNAILFTVFAMLMQAAETASWYKPALQGAFLLAFVVLAPWVGRFADRQVKGRVLMIGNGLKAAGAALLFVGVEPLLAYALVGVGAAVYGPAKYGILPELVGHERLVQANGLIEGSTIVAIVLGAVIGAQVADQSTSLALAMVAGAYLVSLAGTVLIPRTVAERASASRPAIGEFVSMMRGFFSTSRARFSMLGASIFWAAAVVLRVMLVVWAPVVLLTASTSEIANLTVFIALGIAAGAFVVPWLIPIERLRRARMAAYLMGAAIILLGTVTDPLGAKRVLFVIGLLGGVFVVPINAALQDLGHRTIGTGAAVAVQNFFENLAMLVGTGLYTLSVALGADPVLSIYVLGLLVMVATAIVAWHLPRDPEPLPEHPLKAES